MVLLLAERLYGLERLVAAGTAPVLAQLGLVYIRPFDHETQGARRELAGYDLEVFDVDGSLVVSIRRVKVRSTEMVALVVIHPDHDPVERADPRHALIVAEPSDTRVSDARFEDRNLRSQRKRSGMRLSGTVFAELQGAERF